LITYGVPRQSRLTDKKRCLREMTEGADEKAPGTRQWFAGAGKILKIHLKPVSGKNHVLLKDLMCCWWDFARSFPQAVIVACQTFNDTAFGLVSGGTRKLDRAGTASQFVPPAPYDTLSPYGGV
jgi:hypothetical protein